MVNIINFVEYLDFNECTLQNFGHEFFSGQLVLTIATRQFGNTDDNTLDNGILINLIFDGVECITISSDNYTLSSNKITQVTSMQFNDEYSLISFAFLSSGQEIIVTFKASSFEGEILNPYYDFNKLFVD